MHRQYSTVIRRCIVQKFSRIASFVLSERESTAPTHYEFMSFLATEGFLCVTWLHYVTGGGRLVGGRLRGWRMEFHLMRVARFTSPGDNCISRRHASISSAIWRKAEAAVVVTRTCKPESSNSTHGNVASAAGDPSRPGRPRVGPSSRPDSSLPLRGSAVIVCQAARARFQFDFGGLPSRGARYASAGADCMERPSRIPHPSVEASTLSTFAGDRVMVSVAQLSSFCDQPRRYQRRITTGRSDHKLTVVQFIVLARCTISTVVRAFLVSSILRTYVHWWSPEREEGRYQN